MSPESTYHTVDYIFSEFMVSHYRYQCRTPRFPPHRGILPDPADSHLSAVHGGYDKSQSRLHAAFSTGQGTAAQSRQVSYPERTADTPGAAWFHRESAGKYAATV